MLRRLLCFTLLVLLTPALALAQRCELLCRLAPVGNPAAATVEAARSPPAAMTPASAHGAADRHASGSTRPRGCTLAHLPALLRQPMQVAVLAAPPSADEASSEFRSIILAPPEPRPKTA